MNIVARNTGNKVKVKSVKTPKILKDYAKVMGVLGMLVGFLVLMVVLYITPIIVTAYAITRHTHCTRWVLLSILLAVFWYPLAILITRAVLNDSSSTTESPYS